ncbi:hypothetical protein A2191_02575 [Candidatus Woesebacteria bacterium RIFOXYA1_FULL_38_9]|nr:MAG: hypothetical protein A2191_02575 [Candidatus Woesebacteria bacterium RIFOXYA1_FULL_38_9]
MNIKADPMQILEKIPFMDRLSQSAHVFPLPGGLVMDLSYLQAGAMIFLIFLLILTLGQFRRHVVDWQMGGIIPGIALGFALTVILEGTLLVSGRTLLTETLGWKNAPKPVSRVLDLGRDKLVEVLGVESEIPLSQAQSFSVDEVSQIYQSMSSVDAVALRMLICKP